MGEALHADEIVDENIFINTRQNPVKENIRSMSFWNIIKTIFTQKIFILNVLALASLFFIITVVQFWATDYMKKVLLISNKDSIKLSFAIICITSPTLGVVIGGIVTTKIGGYEKKEASLLILILAALASLFAILTVFANSIITFTIFLWLVLFFGGAIIAPITGIIITSLSSDLRGSANSITSLISNLFGYLPGPFVYGSMYESTKLWHPKFAFGFVMFYSLLGLVFLLAAAILRYRKLNSLEKEVSTHSRKVSKEILPPNALQKMFGSHMDASAVKSDEEEVENSNLGIIEEHADEGERGSTETDNKRTGSKATPFFLGNNHNEHNNMSNSEDIVSPAFGRKNENLLAQPTNIEILMVSNESENENSKTKTEIELSSEK